MSYIIEEMGLQQPPFTVRKTGSRYAPLWFSDCADCGQRTTPRRLLSDVLRAVYDHLLTHRLLIFDQQVEAAAAARKAAAA